MSGSEDVKTLFRRFGGQAETYQEVVREDQAVQSLGRWTMLGQVDVGRPQAIPSARRAIKTAETRHNPEIDEPIPSPEPQAPTTVVSPPDKVLKAVVAIVAAPSNADRPDSAGPRSALAPRQRASAPVAAASKPSLAQAVVQPRQSGFLTPRQPSKPDVQIEPTPATKRISPLAARLKTPTAAQHATMKSAATTDNSLPGLFNRLSGTSSPKTKPGVLKRKLNK